MTKPLYDDAYIRGVAVGFAEGDSRRETLLRIADRAQSSQADAKRCAIGFTLLRSALVGMIGADDAQELRNMEAVIRQLPAPDADKAVSINAIHALLATLE